jgi:4'-phosphopantetheinyl transferase EntD
VTVAAALSNESIERLFATGVSVETSRTADCEPGDLLPQEQECVPRATAKRLADFAAGRRCARSALRRLGVTGHPLVVGAGGAPAWPAGIVGSISHCDGVCAAAVASARLFGGLGLDIETDKALDEDLRPFVCSDDEHRRITKLRPPPVGNWEKVIFSVKESVFKCWYPLGRLRLEFDDVEVALLPEHGAFRARVSPSGSADAVSPRSIGGRYCWADGYVVSAASLPASPA